MTVQKNEEGFSIKESSYSALIGQKGIASTILRPSGKIKIDNHYYDALAKFGYIEKGEIIQVSAYENAQLVVMKSTLTEEES